MDVISERSLHTHITRPHVDLDLLMDLFKKVQSLGKPMVNPKWHILSNINTPCIKAWILFWIFSMNTVSTLKFPDLNLTLTCIWPRLFQKVKLFYKSNMKCFIKRHECFGKACLHGLMIFEHYQHTQITSPQFALYIDLFWDKFWLSKGLVNPNWPFAQHQYNKLALTLTLDIQHTQITWQHFYLDINLMFYLG